MREINTVICSYSKLNMTKNTWQATWGMKTQILPNIFKVTE